MLTISLAGDLHYPEILEEKTELLMAKDSFFTKYLQAFLGTAADYHVFIGDTTHNGLAKEYQDLQRFFVQRPEGTVKQVLGNHDILSLPKKELLSITGQARYEKVETDQAVLLFLDTTKEFQLHGWGLDAEQWEWLDAQITMCPNKVLMIFAHHPVPSTTVHGSSVDPTFEPYQDIRPLLRKRQGTAFYFNGHAHFQSFVHQEPWYFIQTTAPICNPSYRVVELDGTVLRVKTIHIQDESILESGKLLYDRLSGFYRPSIVASTGDDLHFNIEL